MLRGKKTQGEFAKCLGLQQATYSRYENGKREPDLESLCQIGKVTGVSIDYLLGLTDAPGDHFTPNTSETKLAAVKLQLQEILKSI